MKRSQGNLTQLVASLLAILCFSQTRCFGQGGKGKQGGVALQLLAQSFGRY